MKVLVYTKSFIHTLWRTEIHPQCIAILMWIKCFFGSCFFCKNSATRQQRVWIDVILSILMWVKKGEPCRFPKGRPQQSYGSSKDCCVSFIMFLVVPRRIQPTWLKDSILGKKAYIVPVILMGFWTIYSYIIDLLVHKRPIACRALRFLVFFPQTRQHEWSGFSPSHLEESNHEKTH